MDCDLVSPELNGLRIELLGCLLVERELVDFSSPGRCLVRPGSAVLGTVIQGTDFLLFEPAEVIKTVRSRSFDLS